MNIILYSLPTCPKCDILKEKLYGKKIDFTIVEDTELMTQKGITATPILEVDDKIMNYMEAVKFVNEY